MDYVEQTSWILFLKNLDDLEKDRATAAELTGKTYTPIIDKEYQSTVWATPKGKDGKLVHHNALTGDDLTDFVNNKLFPYLKKFKNNAESADTIEYKIGEIFSELKNRIQSGYNLREVINRIDELRLLNISAINDYCNRPIVHQFNLHHGAKNAPGHISAQFSG